MIILVYRTEHFGSFPFKPPIPIVDLNHILQFAMAKNYQQKSIMCIKYVNNVEHETFCGT